MAREEPDHEGGRPARPAGRPRALADFDWLISRYPKIALAFVFRGQVLRHKNNDIDALKDYSRAVELDPQNADARRGKGWTPDSRSKGEAPKPDHPLRPSEVRRELGPKEPAWL